MTTRNILLFLHISSAIIILGALVFMDMVGPGLVRGGRENLGALRMMQRMGRIFGPSAAIIFLLGVALVIRNDWSFGKPWISASMGLFIVAAVIGAVPVGKALESAVSKIENGESADAEAGRLGMLGGINILILLTIVYLMVAKPGGVT